MDTDGRWTLKRGRKRSTGPGETHERSPSELAIPVFGYKNHLGIDRHFGFIRTFAVTNAARARRPPARQSTRWREHRRIGLGRHGLPLDGELGAAGARGLAPQFQRPKPRGKPMPAHLARGNAARARVRVAAEHVFAVQKCRLALVIHSIGLARAKTKLGFANLVTNMRRFVCFETRNGAAVTSTSGFADRPPPPTKGPATAADTSSAIGFGLKSAFRTGSSRCSRGN
jgi:transposase, IS5 family